MQGLKNGSILFVVLLSVFISPRSHAQIGGNNTYEILNLTVPARLAALGGSAIGIRDKDLNLIAENPAALNAEMHNSIALNYVNFFGVNYGFLSYARNIRPKDRWAASLLYCNYGNFNRTDEMGNVLGTFSGGEYVFSGTYNRSFDSVFTMGATLKLIYSQLDAWNSFGFAVDYAANYHSRDKLTSVTALIKNFGANLKPFNNGQGGPIPFEIQLGVSHRLKYVPIRLSAVITNLNRPNLAPDNPNAAPQTDPLTGEVIEQKTRIGDKIMRHFIFGAELMPSKNLFLRFGYNYQRRQEMKIADRAALVGFSYGVGIRISKFDLAYSRASWSLAGGSNYLSISTNIDSFKQKRKEATPANE